MTRAEVLACVLGLTIEDFVAGPEPNRDRANEVVWMFGARIADTEIYVKLAVVPGPACVCLSFHEAEYPLVHPYRPGRPDGRAAADHLP